MKAVNQIKIETKDIAGQFYDICRICLRNNINLCSIFHHTTNGFIEDLSIKMKFCSEINICENDGLPENICENCVELLNKAYMFKTLSTQSDLKLRNVHNILQSKDNRESSKVTFVSEKSENLLNKTVFDSNVLKYSCSFCSKTFSKKNLFNKHSRFHKKITDCQKILLKNESPKEEFQCNTCSKTFKSKIILVKHIDLHNSAKRYVCEICGRSFEQRRYLKIHLLKHTGDKRYECSICGFKTAYRNSLTIHIRKHTGLRPFTCDVCGYTCISSSNLYVHQRQHIGAKYNVLKCKLCSKRFGYKSSLNEHITATHKGLKNYTCSKCDKSYSRKRGLRRHIQLKH